MRRSIYIDEFAHKSPIPNASRIGNIIVSGLLRGVDPATQAFPPTVEQQCEFMFANLRRCVEAGGAQGRGHHQGDVLDEGIAAQARQ